jgi:Tol biopolymer transport system component
MPSNVVLGVVVVGAGLVSAAPALGAADASTAAGLSPAPGEPWIVYNGALGTGAAIRLVRTDGTDDHAVFGGLTPGEQRHPDWPPDGASIVFAADDVDGTRDLWMGPADGSSAERIYDCAAPCGWSADPAWPPDGRSILFQRGSAIGDAGLGLGSVDVLDLGSRAIETLFTGAETEYLYVPRWAPDMHAFVMELERFPSGRLDESHLDAATIAIVELTADRPAARELLPDSTFAAYPDWGADGRIVFMRPVGADLEGPSDLYAIDPGGGDPTRVTTTGQEGRQALQPSWTPDGDRIIFVEQDDFGVNVRMATIRPDGTDVTTATSGGDMFGTHPRLRPGSTPAEP